MHQLITGSDTSIQPSATHVSYGVRCHVTSGYDWTDICQPWGEGVLLQCLAVSADASSNQNVYSQNNMLFTAKLVIFCSVISQGKVVALDRWGGKWNHLSMTHRLTTNYAKNYCNQALIVKVIVENVVTCFLGTRCRFHENFWQTDWTPAVNNETKSFFFAFWCFNSLQTQQVTQDANTSSLSFLQTTSGIPYSSPASISEVFRRVVNIFGSKQTIKSMHNC